jgi:hypothetical protein
MNQATTSRTESGIATAYNPLDAELQTFGDPFGTLDELGMRRLVGTFQWRARWRSRLPTRL